MIVSNSNGVNSNLKANISLFHIAFVSNSNGVNSNSMMKIIALAQVLGFKLQRSKF